MRLQLGPWWIVVCVLLIMGIYSKTSGRTEIRQIPERHARTNLSLNAQPAWCSALHDINKISLEVTNYGTFQTSWASDPGSFCHTGTYGIQSAPGGAIGSYFVTGGIWIGGVIERDTVVSTGRSDRLSYPYGLDFDPDEAPFGFIDHRSIIDPLSPEYEGAVSEQDYISVYTDTAITDLKFDPWENREHIPLNVEVTQRSYAWSYAYAEDFILFDMSIKNIGDQRLRDVYLGIYVDAAIGWVYIVEDHGSGEEYPDDITGFLKYHPLQYGGCEYLDTVNLAWFADNNGALNEASDTITPVPGIIGMRLIRTPSDSLNMSFNWWSSNYNTSYDYGPQTIAKFRDLRHGGTGTPNGDKNKYHYLSNGEFDFDQIYTKSILPGQTEWVFPNQVVAEAVSKGGDSRYLLSFGPFNIAPGQQLPVSFAYIRGDNFHRDPTNAPKYLTGEVVAESRTVR